MDGRDRPVLDRQGRPVPVEQRLQRCNGRLGALNRLLHALQMCQDRLIADGDVGRVQDGADLLEWHVEVAEPADDLRDRNLAGRVTAVAAGTVDLRRAHEAHVVVVAKRLHAQMRHPGELTDGQQHAHVLSVHPSPTGESSARRRGPRPARTRRSGRPTPRSLRQIWGGSRRQRPASAWRVDGRGELSRSARGAPTRRGRRLRAAARPRRTGRGRRRRGGRATDRLCHG